MLKAKHWVLIAGSDCESIAESARNMSSVGYNLVLVGRRAFDLNLFAQELELRYEIETRVISDDDLDMFALRRTLDELKESGLEIHYLVNKLWKDADFKHSWAS
ncbi:MAG TPA: hypothetical protein PLU50_10345 [Pseudobdellovibrionaceae bacterium]|nr:hypothetical protein [Pseudobdellovibrionaceae bacterium]